MKTQYEPNFHLRNVLPLIFWLVLMMALLAPSPAYADDCLTDPLNAADCMRTGGFRQGITVVIGGAATAGVIISNILSAGTSGVTLPPGVPPPRQHVVPPEDLSRLPPEMDEWQRKWIEKGWRWSPEDDGFVPQPGAVSENGQIWYRPPWDQGDEFWVDRSTYDDIQEHLRDGDVWSDRWGWKRSEEIQHLDAERDRRWREFTDPEAGKRRHQRLMQEVREAVENDPEYQRVKRELDAIRERLNEMQRQSLRDEIAFYQRAAARHNRRDHMLGIASIPFKVIKSTADFTIDVLGTVPGAPRYIKWAYKGATNFVETSITTGSYYEGLKAGAEAAGKEVLGDIVGDQLKIPGVKSLPGIGRRSVGDLIKSTGVEEIGQVTKNFLVGQGISKGGVDPFFRAGKNIITGSKDPIFTVESVLENPYAW